MARARLLTPVMDNRPESQETNKIIAEEIQRVSQSSILVPKNVDVDEEQRDELVELASDHAIVEQEVLERSLHASGGEKQSNS